MSLVALVICGVVVIYLLFFRQSRQAKMLSRVPGPSTLPIFGNALSLNVSNEVFFRNMRLGMVIHRGMSIGFVFHMPYLSVARVDAVQKVLSSSSHIDKSADYDMLMPWLGTGLLTSQGQKWFNRRKLLTPAFHFKILEDFIDVFNEQATTLVQVLKEEFGDGRIFNVYPYITRCALDIICETAMGKKINAQQEKDSEYVKAIHRIGELIQYRQMRPWFHPNFIWQLTSSGKEEKKLLRILHGFTEKVIAEKKAELRMKTEGDLLTETKRDQEESEVYMKGKRRVAFLDLLIRAQSERNDNESDNLEPPLTDQDIREEADTFMFEGHDTTAANVNWTVFLLACNQECQKKVQEELDLIFGEDKERHVTTADISQMKYLDCCIKESLRLYPSVPFIARAIKTDLELDVTTTIPAGTTAFIMPYQLHRDPTVFPEPEVFLPDRFFPENCVGRNPFAYVPFSAGPRNCIGQKFAIMEEKVMIANVFRNFRVMPGERREDLVLLAELIMRPKNGLHVTLTPRN